MEFACLVGDYNTQILAKSKYGLQPIIVILCSRILYKIKNCCTDDHLISFCITYDSKNFETLPLKFCKGLQPTGCNDSL